MASNYFITIRNRIIKELLAVVVTTALLTLVYYTHESFPQPLRAVTALLCTPVGIASGIAHYCNLGVQVYDTPWAVVLANAIGAILIVQFAEWTIALWKRIRKSK